MKVENQVLNYKDLKIIQDSDMFNFCIDSVLLSRFWIPSKKYKNILDFGTNNAIIPLIISRYTKANITGVEIQNEACKIAEENISLNELNSQITIFNQDIKEFVKDKNNTYDLVFCNPPFFKISDNSNLNKRSELLTPARHETSITLEEIIFSAKVALKNGGKLLMVHLSERMDEILFLLKNNNFSVKRIQFVYSKEGQDAKRVLIEAVNDGNDGMKILPPLVIHNEDGTYKENILEMFGD
ncbi:tRNA1(Val) (adenine(37)-N6)-methyltransferase [Spiroplasma sp. BIUS-1]|uniref:tRNA1(Val) (adenine(37)-N6)-methyltransferase n=1 Tax=Spiroplasma sp. BIUS-1 TaxID=216964 RepID=UPI001397BDFC|nr:tRNA1(Val) (adenine(37)-N6)-methyltransferase [Spiroplasma sp. BIUS-1]QHX36264.1 methyltransferase [Spiroplasma sp. BIUS-1]